MKSVILILLISLLLSVTIEATPNAKVVRLKNGVTATIVEKPDAASAQLRVWISGGSAHEQPDQTNTAHIIEHLMFGKYKDNDLPYFTQAKARGTVNATTRHLATVYSTQTTPDNLKFFIDLESKRLRAGPEITAERLAREVTIIRQEHLRTYSQLPYQLWRAFFQEGYSGHPFEWHTSGDEAHLSTATAANVRQFFDTYYVPSGTCLTIVSTNPINEMESWINSAFSDWQPKSNIHPKVIQPYGTSGKKIHFKSQKDSSQAALLGYKIPEHAKLIPQEVDFLNHLFIRSQLNAVKDIIHFSEHQPWEIGELNFDYDWYNVKAIVLSNQYQTETYWQSILSAMGKTIVNLTIDELKQRYEEYYFDLTESLLSSSKLADWLSLQCGKYKNPVGQPSRIINDLSMFKQKLEYVFKPEQMVVIVYGD
jgi:hypothetical protein